jgi:cell division protein FtsI (penicillin-binding protein 3)
MNDTPQVNVHGGRRWLLLALFFAAGALLLARAVDLQILNKEFLQQHGDARAIRVVEEPAHRGMLSDRNGDPLAVSTPVDSVWVVPREVPAAAADVARLAAALQLAPRELDALLRERRGREFVYLKRHVTPAESRAVEALGLPGVHLQREFKRYYPAGEITAHLLGFTNVDDRGQEGIELAYDEWLRGSNGARRVLKDRLGRTVQVIESLAPAAPGRPLQLSLDRRVQYLAWRELNLAVTRNRAQAGYLVMLDAGSGEVLAMVSQPSFNPNNRSGLKTQQYRNRSVTDLFEPGSTLKPFTIAAALMSGRYQPQTPVDTAPGYLRVSDHLIRDIHDFGMLDVTGVIRKSSNVGASKIALALGPEQLWSVYSKVGFGATTGSGFPGEAVGVLQDPLDWGELELATIAFGYGLSVTALQLAQSYTVLANDGLLRPVSLLKTDTPPPGVHVLPAGVVRQVRAMLETVVRAQGTGQRAAVAGYRVAGKTGTVHKPEAGGYAEDRYLSLFAGFAPASAPRLVMVVVIDEPRGPEHFGGRVAAPVFANVMQGALRILDIAPDDLPDLEQRYAVRGGAVADLAQGQ